jgi:hypothetical protein
MPNRLNALREQLEHAAKYAILPERLQARYPDLVPRDPARRGVVERLEAMRSAWGGRDLGVVADLAGHSGFFSQTLLDDGNARRAIVYERDPGAIRIGRLMAAELGIADRIEYVRQNLSLAFLRVMPVVGAILCLNILHHAGITFDTGLVREIGWERYAMDFLHVLRSKCEALALSIGFRKGRPPAWPGAMLTRPRRFADIIERSGWDIVSAANVEDIRRLGIQRAGRRYTSSAPVCAMRTASLLFEHHARALLGEPKALPQRFYHIYMLRRRD